MALGAPTLNVVAMFSPRLLEVAESPAWHRDPIVVGVLTLIDFGPPTAIAVGVYALLTRFFGDHREKRQDTRCRRCRYILKGLQEPRCPECGERV